VRSRVPASQNGANVQERVNDKPENTDQSRRDRQFDEGQAASR
jgi:hypothetical protein